VNVKDWLGWRVPESQTSESLVAVCGTAPVLVQVTESPTLMVSAARWNAKSTMVTLSAAGVLVGSGVSVGKGVGVSVGRGVEVAIPVVSGVWVGVGVAVAVGVGVGVSVMTAVPVGVGVSVAVSVGVGVLVGLGVLLGVPAGASRTVILSNVSVPAELPHGPGPKPTWTVAGRSMFAPLVVSVTVYTVWPPICQVRTGFAAR
jgi:hypothetical protein